jgi:hypothetical protein
MSSVVGVGGNVVIQLLPHPKPALSVRKSVAQELGSRICVARHCSGFIITEMTNKL